MFVCHEASRSGAPTVLLNLLRWLREHSSLEFATVLIHDGELAPEFAQTGPVVLVAGGPGQLRGLATLRRAGWNQQTQDLLSPGRTAAGSAARSVARMAIMRTLRREVIDVHAPELVYLNSASSGSALGFVPPELPVITHVHELGHQLRVTRHYEPTSIAQMLARTDRYIAASDAVARALTDEYAVERQRIATVHDFISFPAAPVAADAVAAFRARLGVPPGGVLIGGVGAVEWRKSPDLFIALARRILDRVQRPELRFVWAGPTYEFAWSEAIEHELGRLGLGERLQFLGPLEDPSQLLAALDVFALTSRSDPFPLVCLEAAAHGVPVVAFDAGGATELLARDPALVADYLDIEGLADRIERLASASPAQRDAIGQRLGARVRERYTVEVAAPAILEQIERMLSPATVDRR